MNILVIIAHPDDEVLGMGGTILKHAKNGKCGKMTKVSHFRHYKKWIGPISLKMFSNFFTNLVKFWQQVF